MRLPAVLICLGLMFAAATGRAAELYTVSGVAVDATAASASQARDTALAGGLQTALGQLFDRLVLSEDRAKLPPMTPQLAGSLLSSLDIVSEKSSTTRYLATLNVAFKKAAVQALLQRQQVSFSDAGTRRLLVTPSAGPAEAAMWQGVWGRLAADSPPLALVVPKPDDAAPPAADGTIAATLSATSEPGKYQLDIQGVTADVFADPSAGDAPFAAAARTALAQYADQIKRATLINLSVRNDVSVTVPLSGFADWSAVQDRLRQVTGVQTATLRQISIRQAQLDIAFLGEPQQFAGLCAQAGLSLKEADGGWVLALAGN